MKSVAVASSLFAGFVFANVAMAASPRITSVASEDRHPVVRFSAPRADYVTVDIAKAPARATDGSFLSENVVDSDFLTDSEARAGVWKDNSQLDPGTYYVLIKASPESSCVTYPPPNYNEVVNPACANGWSEMATLVVPRPSQRWRATARRYTYLKQIEFTTTVTPAGDNVPYRICWRTKAKKLRCLSGTVEGYDWNSAASDTLSIRTVGLATRTTFTWYIRGQKVGSWRVRIR